MRKILTSLLSVFILLGVVSLATGAYFTAQGQTVGNTAQAGTVSLHPGPSDGPTLTVTNLAPGLFYYNVGDSFDTNVSGPTYPPMLHVQNMGTLAFKYKITPAFNSQTVGGYWELLWVRAYRAEGSSNTYVKKYEGLLKDMNVGSATTGVGNLGPGSSHDWRFDIGLDSTANNTYQAASANFNFVVDATQTNNPGWTP